MHILEIPSFFPPYGGEFCLEQTRALQALGHEVRVLSNVQLSVKRSLWEYLALPYGRRWREKGGVEVYQSFQRGLPKTVRPNVERWVDIVRSMFSDYVSRYGMPDALHAHCAKWAGYAAMLIGRQYGVAYIITEHMPVYNLEHEFGPAPSTAWQVPLLREAYERASRVVVVAEELVSDMSPYYGTGYRHTWVSNIIDTQLFRYQSRPAREGRPFRFVCPAIFDWRKGYDVLLKAFDIVAANHDVELHVAGAGTDSRGFRRLLGSCKSRHRVFVHGPLCHSAMHHLFSYCDAVALATRGEVQPLVLLEAMSTGIPFVSTTAVPQCERLPGSGEVVAIDDVEGFAAAMTHIIYNNVDGEMLSLSVAAMASPQVVGRKLEEILQQAVEGV